MTTSSWSGQGRPRAARPSSLAAFFALIFKSQKQITDKVDTAMTEKQIDYLEQTMTQYGVTAYWKDCEGLVPLARIQHDHKENPNDPDEPGEPVAWLGRRSKPGGECISLWGTEIEDIQLVPDVAKWPQD